MKRSRPGMILRSALLLFVLSCFFLAPAVLPQEETGSDDEATVEESQQAEDPNVAADEEEEAEEAEEPEEAPPAEPMPAPPAPAPEAPSEGMAADLYVHPEGPHHPPTAGKMVGDHWTPYDPPDPESYPAGSEVHIIVPGDTLWDLGETYLENAWLWPQIWDINQYIMDSHWIYPGDPIVLPGAPTVISEGEPEPAPAPGEGEEEAAPVEAEPEPVDELVEELQTAPPVPEMEPEEPAMPPPPALSPVADFTEIYCSNFIDHDYAPPEMMIAEREEGAKSILGPGDIVFLNQGATQGVQPGQEYSIVTPDVEVYHPSDGKTYVGRNVLQIGRLQILAVQDEMSTAQITMACDAVEVGDLLVPFEEVPVPVMDVSPFDPFAVQISGENDGFIVYGRDRKLSYGQGDLVNIDMGAQDGIESGRVFNVYREWGGSVEFASAETYIDGQQQRARELREKGEPSTGQLSVLGQLVVIGTTDTTATAKVLVAVREISIGDRVELQ